VRRVLRLLAAGAVSAVFGLWIGLLLALIYTATGLRDRRNPHDDPAAARMLDHADPGGVAATPVAAPPAAPARRRRAATARRGTASRLSLLATFAGWTGLGFGLGLLLVIPGPLAVGMRPLVVLSGSMEPTLHVGDVTVGERIAPKEARVGDIVTFRAGSGRLTTHRLRAVYRDANGHFAFTTKGDANNAVERWSLPPDGQLSRTVYRVPAVGRVLLASRTPLGRILLVGLPILLLGSDQVARIWRPARKERHAPAPA
jgi:signal peptidase